MRYDCTRGWTTAWSRPREKSIRRGQNTLIVIPMAGLSHRFAAAGYALPKYRLQLHGSSMFAHAVGSFSAYFDTVQFLFVARDIADTNAFIFAECAALGIRNVTIHALGKPTAGQAETVDVALQAVGASPDTPITIFNIDTFRPGFRYPDATCWPESAGYLEVFRGAGANWSYVRPDRGPEPRVLETSEKRPISDLCCTGLYHFAQAGHFREALRIEKNAPSCPELYVAPLYNHLITAGLPVHYNIVAADSVVCCGVPAEYVALAAAGIGTDSHA